MTIAIERWEPFREMMAMRNRIDQLFEDAFAWPGGVWVTRFGAQPALDIYETDSAIKIEVPLPGVKPEEVELTITGATLTIKGEHKAKDEVNDEHYYRREMHYGAFTRSVTLPETADAAKPEATFESGILMVSFPKVVTVEPKRIEIKPKELKTRHVGEGDAAPNHQPFTCARRDNETRRGATQMSEQMIRAEDLGTEEELTLSHDASGRPYVDDERVWSISALGDGIVALTTGIRTVHISAADYWRALHGDASPSTHTAGQLTARLAHIEHHAAALIDALVHEARIAPAMYPAIWEQITALRVALGVSDAEESAYMHAEP